MNWREDVYILASIMEELRDYLNDLKRDRFVYLVLALAALAIFFSLQSGFVQTVNSVAGDFHDKLGTMSIAAGGASQM